MAATATEVRPPPPNPPTDPALGGPLRVSPPAGGGAVIVATDAGLAHAERLGRLGDALARHAGALDRIEPAGETAVRIDAARFALRRAVAIVSRAGGDLHQAMASYNQVERALRERAQWLAAVLAHLWSPAVRTALIAALPFVLGARAAGLGPDNLPLHDLRTWILAHPEVITDPVFVEAVRAGVMSVDDAVGASAGLPPGAMEQLAASAGFDGVEAGAALTAVVAGHAGLLRETPVSLGRVATTPASSAPSGAVERLARVPEGDQLRIERYDAPGEPPRYAVYVGPTETFSPRAVDEPWDLTSNVFGVAGLEAASVRATELAMRDAGIGRDDPVQFIGFSQGGLVATRLAASGEWNAVGLETYGAPAGHIELPAGLSGMAVRNTDDFVPALAGPQLDHHLLQVERRAFDEGSTIPATVPAPAHQREAYVATASVIDEAQSEAVRQQIAAMDAFTAHHHDREGSSITVMTYHAERGGAKVLTEKSLGSADPTSSGSIP